MVIIQLQSPLFDLSPGLAGADDKRDVFLFQDIQSGESRLIRIGMVIQESAVQVSENEDQRAFSRVDSGQNFSPNDLY